MSFLKRLRGEYVPHPNPTRAERLAAANAKGEAALELIRAAATDLADAADEASQVARDVTQVAEAEIRAHLNWLDRLYAERNDADYSVLSFTNAAARLDGAV